MKLFGVGLPRTGTLSQKVALEMAGLGECYHMVNVLGDLSQGPVWRRVLSGETDLREALSGYGASVDWPGGFFFREALDAFPEAKFLLSVRDPQAWERSMRATIWDVLYADSVIQDLSSARSRVDPGWRAYIELMTEMWDRAGMTPDCDLAREMERFNQEVIDTIPADRLLVWSVADGWEPLCEFLEMPVPAAPFPRLNDSASFGERIVDGALLILRQWRESGMPESVASELPA